MVIIDIKVVPKASKSEVVGYVGELLKIRISSIPENGKANKALCRFVALKLGLSESDVIVVSGLKSRTKSLEINLDISKEDVETKLRK